MSDSITGSLTTPNGDWWPYTTPVQIATYPQWTITESPRECAGNVHVFPCPHCATCTCGKATVKREKVTR